ncbi:MAG: septum formation initiator family protein [Muribaculaceae bacterium]|nr:septum formation initiator family protein [Muribaculaceae bacterium]
MKFKILKNKWFSNLVTLPKLVFVGFICSLIFFGDNSCMRKLEYNDQINDLKAQIQANKDSAKIYEAKVRELNTDRETLEKIAREKYGMKRVNEEVYITDIP